MSYFVETDLSGRIIGLYTDEPGYAPVPAGAQPVTEAEAEMLRGGFSGYALVAGAVVVAPVPQSQIDANQIIALQSQIEAIESATHMNRFVREAMILISQQQATALGMTEPQLYAANIGYKKVKDVDTQIIALRDQITALGG